MAHWREFDHVVVNDRFDQALAELQDVVRGGGAATLKDRAGLAELAGRLTAEEGDRG